MKPVLILGLSLATSFVAQAEESTETIVVTGTRTPKLLSNSPVKVDVIDQETIARLSRGTLRQVLDVIPGVVVTRSVKDGYNVQMQGFDGDHVLILVNGQPLVAPTGSSVDLDQISASNIRQIEVVHGAASVLFGSSAMGGVINIITDSTQDSYWQLDVEADSYLENNSEQSLSGNEKLGSLARLQGATSLYGWHSRLNLQLVDTPAYDFDGTTLAENGAKLKKQFASIEVSREIADIDLSWKSAWFDEAKAKLDSLVPGQAVPTPISYLSDVKQWQHDMRLKGQNHWQLSGRYSASDEQSGYSNSLRQTDIELLELDGQKAWMGEDVEWVSGFVIHQDKLTQVKLGSADAEIDDAERHSVESYLQWNKRWGDSEVLMGVRGQHDSDFGWHQALRVGGSYQLETEAVSWKLLAGLGQSYRVPNLKERQYRFDHSNIGYVIHGNENLVPEEALSANLGANGKLSWNDWSISTDVNLHYSNATDFIATKLDPAASANVNWDVYRYQNLEEADLSGIDLSLGAEQQSWKYDFGYSYLNAVDHNNKRLAQRPRHQIKFSITQYLSDMAGQWQLYGVYQLDMAGNNDTNQAVAEADSLTINAVFQYQVWQNLTWRLGIENLFDSHQSPENLKLQLFDARGATSRRVYTGLTYRFDQ